MNIQFVDLKAQYKSIKTEIDAAVSSVIDASAFIGGDFVRKFEEEFAAYLGLENCVGCGNGTDAIQIALKALNIGPQAEVIVPANSFIASSEAITASGAKVVFCDVDPQTNNLDVHLIEEKISVQTQAILAVHLYGRPADMDTIRKIADKHHISVIEDAAQAHGALYNGHRIGTLGDIACFSFYPGKNLGAYGDGGAICTNNPELAKKARMWANHGRTEKYNHEFEGFNSRLDGLQAAILSAKLPHLEDWTEARRRVAARYHTAFKNIPELSIPVPLEKGREVYHLYVVKTDKRDALQQYLKKHGITTGIHYPIGLPFLKAYDYLKHVPQDFPVTFANQSRVLSLPIYAEMTDEQQDYVIQHVKKFFRAV